MNITIENLSLLIALLVIAIIVIIFLLYAITILLNKVEEQSSLVNKASVSNNILTTKLNSYEETIISLNNKIVLLSGLVQAYKLNNDALLQSGKSAKNISNTAEKLIQLAINNTNENEARTAAMKACREIYKNIKK